MKNYSKTLIVFLMLYLVSISAKAQSIHPYKQKFADFQSWPITTPDDINFKNFQPFRAVYSRTYTQASSGKEVNDQVIMIAQRAFWYGKDVILFEVQDVGTPEFDNTNGRTQFYYLDAKTLQLYLAVGPKAGTPEDYTTVRVMDDKIVTSRLNTATGKAEFKELATDKPSFPFRQLRFLMWVAMDLKVGDKVRLEPIFHAPQGVQGPAVGIVTKQTDYEMPDGKKRKSLLVENTNNGTDPIVHQFFLDDKAPYLLGQGLYNADEKKIYRWWLKLVSFELLNEN